MSDEPVDDEKRTADLAKEIFEAISDLLNKLSEKTWNTPEMQADIERQDKEKHLWGKGLLAALAQQLGVIEAALILGDGLDPHTTQDVRESWIRAGHRICNEAMEAQRAEQEEN